MLRHFDARRYGKRLAAFFLCRTVGLFQHGPFKGSFVVQHFLVTRQIDIAFLKLFVESNQDFF